MYFYTGASVDGRLPFWCACLGCFANKVLSLSYWSLGVLISIPKAVSPYRW